MAEHHRLALEHVAAGRWDEAHALIQAQADTLACLIHGYLHRVEGDLGNADYWYRQAGQRCPDNTLQQEWTRLYGLSGDWP